MVAKALLAVIPIALMFCGFAGAETPAGQPGERRVLTENDAEAAGLIDGHSVRLVNNTWNVAPRMNGRDFRQSIAYDPGNLTRNVVITWDFGPEDQAGVLSYPQIGFCESPWSRDGITDLAARIDAIRDLDVTVDLSIAGRTDQFNVAFDIWLTDRPLGDHTTITTELMIWLHTPPGEIVLPVAGTWSSGSRSATVYAVEDFAIEPGLRWRYIAVVYDEPFLSGTVDIDALLRFLTTRGLISGSDHVSGVELGAEVQGYAGRLTLHSVDMVFARTAPTTLP